MVAGSEAWKRVLDHDGTRRLLEQLSVFIKPGDRRRHEKMSFQMKHSSSVTGNFNLALDAQIEQH